MPSNQKRNEVTKSSWQKVQIAIENRDDQAAQKALSEIGPYTTVQSNDGEFAYFDTSGLAGNVSRIIKTLKQCDWALKNNVRREINKCTTPIEGVGNHLNTWLNEYSNQYSKTIPIDAKKLTAKFDEAEKLFKERELADFAQRKHKTEHDRIEYEKPIAESKAKELAKEKDPNTWAERACNSQKLIDISNDTIRREKAGTKHSGVVN